MTCWAAERTAWGCDGRPDRARAAALGPSAEAHPGDCRGRGHGRCRADADRQRRRALHRAGGDRRGAAPVAPPPARQADRRHDYARGAAPTFRARARGARVRRRFARSGSGQDLYDVRGRRPRYAAARAVGEPARQAARSHVALSDRRCRSIQGVLQGIAGAQRGATARDAGTRHVPAAVGCVLHARLLERSTVLHGDESRHDGARRHGDSRAGA